MLDLSKLAALELPKKEIEVIILGEKQTLSIQALDDEAAVRISVLAASEAIPEREPIRAFLCDSFCITGTLGSTEYEADVPEALKDRIYAAADSRLTDLLAAGLEVQISVDGDAWEDYDPEAPVSARFFRFRSAAAGGEWSGPILLLSGPEGTSAGGAL